MRPSLRSTLLATALLSTCLLAPAAPAAAQAPTVCPATFQVLHDDSIGKLKLKAGPYEVTVRGGLSCASSTELFERFLEDFDGILPRPWRINVGAASFRRGSGPAGFSVARVNKPHGGGGGRHSVNGRVCPGTFQVEHSDRVGSLRLPAGPYQVTVLALGKPSCSRASRLFEHFLDDFQGNLPRPWAIDPQTGTFRRGAANYGFRVKPVRG